MKSRWMLIAAATLLWSLAGCSPANDGQAGGTPASSGAPAVGGTVQPVVAAGKPQGSVKVGDRALCVICAVNGGERKEEEVKATIDYKGKTYAFCNLEEKAEFISNTSKYADKQ